MVQELEALHLLAVLAKALAWILPWKVKVPLPALELLVLVQESEALRVPQLLAVLVKAAALISLWKVKVPLLVLVPVQEAVRLSRWLRRALPRGALRVPQLLAVLAKAPVLISP